MPLIHKFSLGPHDPSFAWIVLHATPDDTERAEVFSCQWDAKDFAIRDDIDFVALIQTWFCRIDLCHKAEVVKFDVRAYYEAKLQKQWDAEDKEAAEYEAERAADLADYYRRVL